LDAAAESWAEARRACVERYGRCADALDSVLVRLDTESPARGDLILCAAVCRVAGLALEEEEPQIAARIVEYSLDACRRCAEVAAELDDPAPDAVPQLCDACVDAATTLLLSTWPR
jgi:hypothetical protein